MKRSDRRLIEDYIPIGEISKNSSREKSIRWGHVSGLHLWFARRPLAACRSAVYGALVNSPENSEDRNTKIRFMAELCVYGAEKPKILAAQHQIFESHARRLSIEVGKQISANDVLENRVPRPRVLDFFAGGGSIPLEAVRLGCEAYAMELNPVAYLIEICTLVYPGKFGAPDDRNTGCGVGGFWTGLASEVEYWGNWVLRQAKNDIGDLYPNIPFQPWNVTSDASGKQSQHEGMRTEEPLLPIAYLWTRTVRCKRPDCQEILPLVKQTWLCTKKNKYVGLRIEPDKVSHKVRFGVVSSDADDQKEAIKQLGFDPAEFSKAGNAACPFCGTVADGDYVKSEGLAGQIGTQAMAAICVKPRTEGKIYISIDDVERFVLYDEADIKRRISQICDETGLTVPDEPLTTDAKNSVWCILYGMTRFRHLFTGRQLLALLTFAKWVRLAHKTMKQIGYDDERARAVASYLGLLVDRMADFGSTLCTWNHTGGRGTLHSLARQALPMVWDFVESVPFNEVGASWPTGIEGIKNVVTNLTVGSAYQVTRGSATELPFESEYFDAIIIDPPYYDNIPYSNIADFFYVWLKRSIGQLYPDHFAGELCPKKGEIVFDATRHHDSDEKARVFYEEMMLRAFSEAHRVLKPNAPMVCVYAHKTTAGWSTLIQAMRKAGFIVVEAWPVNTERPGRLRQMESAALASSIFLVARRRETTEVGSYEKRVLPLLQGIVRERVGTLWKEGVSGADLVIAAVGSGLQAYTLFERVEYENGEEVPSDRFLLEVEGLVLDTILHKLGLPESDVAGVDQKTRFYILWRYTYGRLTIDPGEAIVFGYSLGIELDGPRGLSTGHKALLEKKDGKYRLLDYAERGLEEKLGVSPESDQPEPIIDSLHRILWLMENQPSMLSDFLEKTRPSRELVRLVAQALVGLGLKGAEREMIRGSSSERAALEKLLAHWRTLVEEKISWQEQKQLALAEFPVNRS